MQKATGGRTERGDKFLSLAFTYCRNQRGGCRVPPWSNMRKRVRTCHTASHDSTQRHAVARRSHRCPSLRLLTWIIGTEILWKKKKKLSTLGGFEISRFPWNPSQIVSFYNFCKYRLFDQKLCRSGRPIAPALKYFTWFIGGDRHRAVLGGNWLTACRISGRPRAFFFLCFLVLILLIAGALPLLDASEDSITLAGVFREGWAKTHLGVYRSVHHQRRSINLAWGLVPLITI